GLPGRHADAPEFAGEPQAAGDQVLAGDQGAGGGLAGEPSETVQAFAAARVPRFTEGIPGSTAGDASSVASDAGAPIMGAPVGVIVPPAASSPADNRLPIFESVESDWFRRSRRGSDAPESGTPTEVWSSPADEG